MTQAAIEDHAIIGDCGSAALVTSDGTIDWLCWPRFDSPAVFGALLDEELGGHYRIAPVTDAEVSRRYVEDTAVLQTTFRTPTGVLTLTDAMLLEAEGDGGRTLHPEHELVRVAHCEEGEVQLRVEYAPRFDWGRAVPRIEDRGDVGHVVSWGRHVLVLRSDGIELAEEAAGRLVGTVGLAEGERVRCSLGYDEEEPAVLPLTGSDCDDALRRTVAYWREWAGRCTYDGPHADAVVRSIITVKLLTYARSGAIVAASTTSLPEVPGGDANYDYRFCWLRDAALSLRALFELGYAAEGRAFFDWLLHAARDGGRMPIMYDVHGATDLGEQVLDHLSGYRGATPVRVGNEASGQFQLDVYGELIVAGYEYLQFGEELDRGQKAILSGLGESIARRWEEPDNGIWELRDSLRHHTYSKAMCWVGLQRLLELQRQGHLDGLPTQRWSRLCDDIADQVEQRGFDPELGSYVAAFDGRQLDASLLLLPVYGYAAGDAERTVGTVTRIRERLGRGELVYRFLDHDDGDAREPEEGAFGICSFWLAQSLAMAGRTDEADEVFARMLGRANDVGLFSEELDVATGAHLGNTPQAFTHVGLVNAALVLALSRQGSEDPDRAGVDAPDDVEHPVQDPS